MKRDDMLSRTRVSVHSLEGIPVASSSLPFLKHHVPTNDGYDMDILISLLEGFSQNYKHVEFGVNLPIGNFENNILPNVTSSLIKKLEEYFPEVDFSEHYEEIKTYALDVNDHLVDIIEGVISIHFVEMGPTLYQLFRIARPSGIKIKYADMEEPHNGDEILFHFNSCRRRYEKGLLNSPDTLVLTIMRRVV